MTIKTLFISSILALAVASQASAQSGSVGTYDEGGNVGPVSLYVTLGAGGTKELNIKGGSLTLGGAIKAGPILASVTGMDLLLSSGDTAPYFWQQYYGMCENGDTGEFVDQSYCNSLNTRYAFSADVQLLVPHTPVGIGAGRRFGPDNHDVWFGSAGAYWESGSKRLLVTAKLNFGKDYFAGLVTMGIRIIG